MLAAEIEFHRRQGAADWLLEDVRGASDKVAVVYSWRAPDGSRTRWTQVLKLKDGKIVGMRDYASPARALRRIESEGRIESEVTEELLVCVECGIEAPPDARGWRAGLTVGDEGAEEVEGVAVFCPECAAREFGD